MVLRKTVPRYTAHGRCIELMIPAEKVKIVFLNGAYSKGEKILEERDRVGVSLLLTEDSLRVAH